MAAALAGALTLLVAPAVTAQSAQAAPAAAPVHPTAYVANYVDGSVSAIDTVTGDTVATISLGKTTTSVAVTPDGERVYAPHGDDKAISVIDTATNAGTDQFQSIDTATNQVTSTIDTGSRAGLAVSPDGSRVYAPASASNELAVIDTATHTRTATIPVGTTPVAVAVSDDGANAGDDTVSVVDTAAGSVTATVPVGVAPYDLALTPDGNSLYVAQLFASTVSVVDTATNAVTATKDVGVQPISVAITPAAPEADLQVALAATPVPGLAGRIDYTLTITNNGPRTATSGTVATSLTGNVTPNSTHCTTSTGTVTCTVADLAPGASTTRTCTATTPLIIRCTCPPPGPELPGACGPPRLAARQRRPVRAGVLIRTNRAGPSPSPPHDTSTGGFL